MVSTTRAAGAIVFVLVFAVGLGLTLGSPDLPPGRMLYRMLGVQEISLPTLGVPTTTLVSGVFNGVVSSPDGASESKLFESLGELLRAAPKE